MSNSAIRLVSVIFATILIAAGAWAGTAVAQAAAGAGGAVIHSGNTDIVFESAGTNGLPMDRYQAFEQFASAHPDIARALAHNPRLIKSESFAKSHAALAEFKQAHPDVASDFAENPGNYVDMPVAVAASIKKNPIAPQ
jgi:hypothetical protein